MLSFILFLYWNAVGTKRSLIEREESTEASRKRWLHCTAPHRTAVVAVVSVFSLKQDDRQYGERRTIQE